MSDPGAGRVLIVGSPRSGSTWTLRVLSCPEGASFVREPDNVDTQASVNAAVTRLAFGPYSVLEAGSAAPQYAALWDLAFQGRRALRLRRGWGRRMARAAFRLPHPVLDPLLAMAARTRRCAARRSHVVVSSVMAHFSVERIHARFGPRVVVLQRDPLNIASSWLRLDVNTYDVHARPRSRLHEPHRTQRWSAGGSARSQPNWARFSSAIPTGFWPPTRISAKPRRSASATSINASIWAGPPRPRRISARAVTSSRSFAEARIPLRLQPVMPPKRPRFGASRWRPGEPG